jgi:hypothetical protein
VQLAYQNSCILDKEPVEALMGSITQVMPDDESQELNE